MLPGGPVIRQDDFQRLISLREGAFHRLADGTLQIVGDDGECHQRAVCRVGHDLALTGQPMIS